MAVLKVCTGNARSVVGAERRGWEAVFVEQGTDGLSPPTHVLSTGDGVKKPAVRRALQSAGCSTRTRTEVRVPPLESCKVSRSMYSCDEREQWKRVEKFFVLLVAILCIAQLIWFGLRAIRYIDFDGITYVGIAAELRTGEFRASINAFRSPLISWLIAVVPFAGVLSAGKLITVCAFLGSAILLYVFTLRLWGDRKIGLSAVALFVLARGVTFIAVAFVSPDFLLTAFVILYFDVLLRCLRKGDDRWWTLGWVHGVAYLAKGIALPWLTVCTLIAALLSHGRWQTKLLRFFSATIIVLMFAFAWSSVLYMKYGVFTTGTQFKVNLLQWTLHDVVPPQPARYQVLRDISHNTSLEMDYDPMPPQSWQWQYHPPLRIVLWRVFAMELNNLPLAAKELVILLTPGIPVAFLATCWTLRSNLRKPAGILAITILAGTVVVVTAYAMLTIDTRYFYPLLPLWFAFGLRYVFSRRGSALKEVLRACCIVLIFAGVVFSATYPASPYRVQKRDWQVICRVAGSLMRAHSVRTVVSVGAGPFPDNGVGWEAGFAACHFGRARLIAISETIPRDVERLASDIAQTAPDAVIVWSEKDQLLSIKHSFASQYGDVDQIIDPVAGEVGLIFYRNGKGNLDQKGLSRKEGLQFTVPRYFLKNQM